MIKKMSNLKNIVKDLNNLNLMGYDDRQTRNILRAVRLLEEVE